MWRTKEKTVKPPPYPVKKTARPTLFAVQTKSTNVFLLIAAFAIAAGCTSDVGLSPFRSDGCSLFPDRSVISQADWCSCCFKHDLAYWRGGTYQERTAADQRLKSCVLKKTGNKTLATLMYEGVRVGGSPYFYNWYRWGYGWPYERKYQILTPEEESLADRLVKQYIESPERQVCQDSPSSP